MSTRTERGLSKQSKLPGHFNTMCSHHYMLWLVGFLAMTCEYNAIQQWAKHWTKSNNIVGSKHLTCVYVICYHIDPLHQSHYKERYIKWNMSETLVKNTAPVNQVHSFIELFPICFEWQQNFRFVYSLRKTIQKKHREVCN